MIDDDELDLTFDDLEGFIPDHLMKIIMKDAKIIADIRKLVYEVLAEYETVEVKTIRKMLESTK